MPESLVPVDVVIPVYRGEAETRACVESVLAARNDTRCEIVVIDDASPEPALSAWLRSVAASGRITLIVHDANGGFVATANEGMGLHPDRDVVLLNSDTEVADGWLDRLVSHAERDRAVGTATPFSTNATICSYPRTLADNALPRGETTASLDSAFAAANAGHCIDIPTAVGFCMHIPRRCLDAVGVFDEARYGAGYGEEVDFCMRAARAGFRNVLAADVFVRHVGEVSFGNSGMERRAKAQATVDVLYPEFQVRLREYLDSDPACEARRRADLERLRRARAPRELFAGPFTADVKERIDALAAAGEHEILVLTPWRESFVELSWAGRDEELRLWFHREEDAAQLTALLGAIGVSRVHGQERDMPAAFPASGLPDVARLRLHAPAEAPPPPVEPAPPVTPAQELAPARGVTPAQAGAPSPTPQKTPGLFARLLRRFR